VQQFLTKPPTYIPVSPGADPVQQQRVAKLGAQLAAVAPGGEVSLVPRTRGPVPVDPADPNPTTRPSTAAELAVGRRWSAPESLVASAPETPSALSPQPPLADSFDQEFQPVVRERMRQVTSDAAADVVRGDEQPPIRQVTVPGLVLSGMDPEMQRANMQRYGEAIQSGRSIADVTPVLESGQGVAIFGKTAVPSRAEQLYDAVEAATMTVPRRLPYPRMESRVNPETNDWETVITDGHTRMVFDHRNYSSPFKLDQDIQTGLRQFKAMRIEDEARRRQVASDAVADVMRRYEEREERMRQVPSDYAADVMRRHAGAQVEFVPEAVMDVPATSPAAPAAENMRTVAAFDPIADFRQTQKRIEELENSLAYYLRGGREFQPEAAATMQLIQALHSLAQQQYLAAVELERARIPSAAAVNAAARSVQADAAAQAQQQARASAAEAIRKSFVHAGADPRALATINLIPDHLLVDVDERGNAAPAAWVLALAFPKQRDELIRSVRPDQLDDIREHIKYLDDLIATTTDPELRSQLILARRNAYDLLLSLGAGAPESKGRFEAKPGEEIPEGF
jgi:hypothetical protein